MNIALPLFVKVSTLKRMGANYFFLEWTLFQNGFAVQESKLEVTKVVSL